MYKVFFKDRIFSLRDESFLANKDENTYIFKDVEQLKHLIYCFINENNNITVIHTSLPELWQIFQSILDTKHAAGGVTIKEDSFLAIKKWGIWDLPKGHVEEGETFEVTAIREVEEETGITKPEIVSALPSTYHIYIYENKIILKISHWYRMSYKGDDSLIPQQDEDITEVEWILIKEKEKFIRNTYPTLYSIVEDL